MKSAVCYIRVSTLGQADEGVSLEAQEAALRAYCAMRGLEVAEVIRDPGVSAGKPLADRPGGRRVLEAIRSKQAQHVVAYKLDRLFRDAVDCLGVVRDWDNAGVSMHLVDMGGQAIDTASAMGRFFLTVMAAMAEMERGLTRERTIAALGHKRRKGERIGQIPYGMRLATDGVSLEPDPFEAIVVDRILEMKTDRLSLERIAGQLNTEGVPARGDRWHPTTVARILKRYGEPVSAPQEALPGDPSVASGSTDG